ncbi:MAG: MFS transporter [Thermoplasmata archaeon]|nr:MFS transporter [Thermoplasmata archaeon]
MMAVTQSTSALPTRPAASAGTSSRAGTILAVLALSALLVNFIETMLVPALPTLVKFFDGVPYTTVAWILSIYLLIGVCTTPLFAKLGDIYGKRRILMVVLSVYAVAVVLAPFTPDIASALGLSRSSAIFLLIAVRGLQGFGLAMFPLAFAMVGEELPPARVAPAQGLIAAMFAGGAAAGIAGGAWLIQAVGWQWAYGFVAVPAAVLAIASTRLPDSRHLLAARLDVPGAAFLGTAVGSFLLALTLGPTWGWTNLVGGHVLGIPLGTPTFLAAGLLLTLAFYARERATDEPMFDLKRFRERNIGLGYLAAALVGLSLFVAFVTLTILVEVPVIGLGRSILDFGLASLPTTLVMLTVAPLVGQAISRYGPRPMMILGGLVSMSGFLLLFEFHSTYTQLVVEAIPTFAGLVTVLVSTTNVIVLSARKGETGIQTGMLEMLQDLGAALAPVLVTSILASVTSTYANVVVPSPAAFRWLFGLGAAFAVACVGIGALIRNYRFPAESASSALTASAADRL